MSMLVVSPSHVDVTTNAHEASTSTVPVVVQGSALNPLAPGWPRHTAGDMVTRHSQLLAAIHVPHATLKNFDSYQYTLQRLSPANCHREATRSDRLRCSVGGISLSVARTLHHVW